MSPAPPFRYDGYRLDPDRSTLTCHYSLGERRFAERVSFTGGAAWQAPAVDAAARLVFLLAGVSYYKTAAPGVIDLGDTAVTDAERAFLASFYLDGLGEFGYRNGLDLSGLRIEGPRLPRHPGQPAGAAPGHPAPGGRPLVPFGGGIDSIVTVELVRQHTSPALFIVGRPSRRPPRSPGCPSGGPSGRSTRSCSAPPSLASLTATCR